MYDLCLLAWFGKLFDKLKERGEHCPWLIGTRRLQDAGDHGSKSRFFSYECISMSSVVPVKPRNPQCLPGFLCLLLPPVSSPVPSCEAVLSRRIDAMSL